MMSKTTKIIILALMLVFCSGLAAAGGTVETGGKSWTCDGIADQVEINQAIEAGDYIRLSGDFCINDPVKVDSNTVLDGQGETKIKLDENVNRLSKSEYRHSKSSDYANPMIPLIGQMDTNIEDIEIKGISFDGNYNNNLDLIKGRGYYNIIFFKHATGVKVHDNYFTNSHGDSCRLYRCANIQYYNNEADSLGHEGLFCIESPYIEAWGNTITCMIDNAFRVNACDFVYIHDNTIYSVSGSPGAGPGIQVQLDNKVPMHVEISNNKIMNTYGPGIWVVGTIGNYDPALTFVYIHHNAFLGSATNKNINWVGGVLTSCFHSVTIENNVFDGVHGSGVTSMKVKGLSTAGNDFTIDVKNNIITNTQKRNTAGENTGYAFDNTLSGNHIIKSDFNILWNNKGNYKNLGPGKNDLFQDPKINPGGSGWRWIGSAWVSDYMSVEPGSMWTPGKSADKTIGGNEDKPVPGEFDNIFDILDLEFSNDGRTGQKAEDIDIELEEYTKGLVYGGMKIPGFADVVYIDGVPYIPDENAILVKYQIIKSPDLIGWIGRIKKIDKDLNITIKNGTAYAVLTVETDWYTVTTNHVTGKKKTSKIKTSTAVFRDSCSAPEILTRPTKRTGFINEYRSNSTPNTRVYVPPEGFTKIVYRYGDNESTHTFLIGERQADESGIFSTNYTRVDRWDGGVSNLADSLIIYGNFDKDKLKITCFTPYESFEITDLKYTVHELPARAWVKPLIAFLLRFFLMLFCGYKLMRIIIPH